MNAIFELAWKQWDRKISELEEKSAKEALEGVEVRYLNDIIRQNIAEMKELRAKLAEMTMEKEKLSRKIARITEPKRIE